VAGYLPILLDWPMTIAGRSAAVSTPLVPAGYACIIWAPLSLRLSVLAFWRTRLQGRTLDLCRPAADSDPGAQRL